MSCWRRKMLIEMIQFDEDGLIGLGLVHELRPLKSPKSDGDSYSEPCLGLSLSSGSERARRQNRQLGRSLFLGYQGGTST
jgi:hypothetical protein